MKLDRSVSSIGLLFISVSSIMGSGWLFSSFYATQNAGPASILSWIIGGVFILIVAFTFAEVFSLVPVSGASVRIPQITHGNVIGVFCSLAFWFTYVVLIVIEVQAVVQYLCFYCPSLMSQNGGLSVIGYVTSVVLLFILCIVNTASMKWVAACNSILTCLKILIPIFLGIFLLVLFFTVDGLLHPLKSVFAPFGIHGIFAAISTGGIVFSYNGFKFSCEVGGETKNPGFAIPFAVIGSILLCMVIFLLLQSSFLVALKPEDVKSGWGALTLFNNNSPFASLLQEHGIKWMIPILYVGAVISPLAAGLIYCTCASRSLLGIALNGYAPKVLTKMNKFHVPHITIWVNFVLAMIIFNFFRGWHQIADLLTYLFALTFVFGPICLITFRKQLPERKRHVRIPFVYIWSYVALYLCTLFIYWVGWDIISKTVYFLIFCIIVSFIVQLITKETKEEIKKQWLSSLWLWLYAIVVFICSYLGNFGGHCVLEDWGVMLVMAIANIFIMYLAMKYKRTPEQVKAETDYI